MQSALDIRKATKDRQNEWIPLSYLGEVYVNLNNYSQSLEFYQSALNIIKELKATNPKSANDFTTDEKSLLADIAAVYFRLGQYKKSLDYYQQNLALEKAVNNELVLPNSQ